MFVPLLHEISRQTGFVGQLTGVREMVNFLILFQLLILYRHRHEPHARPDYRAFFNVISGVAVGLLQLKFGVNL